MSSQNAALLQYRIPINGAFVVNVKFVHNPKRKSCFYDIIIIKYIQLFSDMFRRRLYNLIQSIVY